jgi:hypothetical protein
MAGFGLSGRQESMFPGNWEEGRWQNGPQAALSELVRDPEGLMPAKPSGDKDAAA